MPRVAFILPESEPSNRAARGSTRAVRCGQDPGGTPRPHLDSASVLESKRCASLIPCLFASFGPSLTLRRFTSVVGPYRWRKGRQGGPGTAARATCILCRVSGPLRALILLLTWSAAAVILRWGRISAHWRRWLALAVSAAGFGFLILALNTGGLREASSTGGVPSGLALRHRNGFRLGEPALLRDDGPVPAAGDGSPRLPEAWARALVSPLADDRDRPERAR